MKKTIIVAFLAISVLLAIAVVFPKILLRGLWSESPPSDDKLISMYHSHRPAFDALRGLVQDDAGRQSFYSLNNLDDLTAADRRATYKSLILSIDKNLTIYAAPEGHVRFVIASHELSSIGPGWFKGIEYIPDKHRIAGVLRRNLNDVASLTPDVYLRKMEKNWYLVYQMDGN